MNKLFKLLSLAIVLTLTVAACNDKKACKEDCKKECCEGEEAKACKPGCEKACCKDKEAATEAESNENAHTCTAACTADPHSCPNHSHDDHGHDH